MNSGKLHICIIGCGEIARNAHAPSFKKLGDKIQFSFSSRERKKAQEYCDKFGGIKAYRGIGEVFMDKDVDAVSICLPHDRHYEFAVDCANAQKHILLEKPMACSIKEAEEIIKAAKKNHVKLAIAECLAYSRTVEKAKELLVNGEIGEFRFIISTQFFMVNAKDWRLQENQMGGGALMDGGVHTINVFHQVSGPVSEVFCFQPTKIKNEMQGEDTTFTLMKFKNGGVGEYNYSWSIPHAPKSPHFQIHGTQGTLYDMDGLFLVKHGQEKTKISLPQDISDGYDWMMEDFVGCILNDKEPRMTGTMGKQDIAVALAAYESAKTGQCIKL